MKTKLLIAIIALCVTASAHANLIDLTPGGFDLTQPFPVVVANFFRNYGHGMQNIAGALVVNGQPEWSPFTLFGDDQFDLTLNPEGTGADVGWDLSGTGYHLRFVFVESSDLLAHLYAVRGGELLTGDGFIEIDGMTPILAATFAGGNMTPEGGSTLVLMGLGFVALFFWQRRILRGDRTETAPSCGGVGQGANAIGSRGAS